MTVWYGALRFYELKVSFAQSKWPYLYIQGCSTLCSPPRVLCTRSLREQPLCIAGSSAVSHWNTSLSSGSMNSIPATVHQLPKQKERQHEMSQRGKASQWAQGNSCLKGESQSRLLNVCHWRSWDVITHFFVSTSFYVFFIMMVSCYYQLDVLLNHNGNKYLNTSVRYCLDLVS